MSVDAQTVLREALSLPDGDRADIAASLLASLDDAAVDDPELTHELWSDELQRRARRVLSGEGEGQDWDEVRQRLVDDVTSE